MSEPNTFTVGQRVVVQTNDAYNGSCGIIKAISIGDCDMWIVLDAPFAKHGAVLFWYEEVFPWSKDWKAKLEDQQRREAHAIKYL